MCSNIYISTLTYIYIEGLNPVYKYTYIYIIAIHFMHHLVTMHHNQIYFIHISILTKYSDHVQLRSHFYNLSLAHNVHKPNPQEEQSYRYDLG